MGCMHSIGKKKKYVDSSAKGGDTMNVNTTKKEFSWEKNKKLNPDDYAFEKLEDVVVGKIPGSINGEGFALDSLNRCDVYLMDHSDSVQVDDCIDCRIFIGPTAGSVFIRDCSNCKFIVACQQFRTRDCHDLQVLLHCRTKPIIESSENMKFACFHYYYPKLEDQFIAAGLSPYVNNWSNIYDFTVPSDGSKNYSFLPTRDKMPIHDILPSPTVENLVDVGVDNSRSTVPYVHGSRPRGDLPGGKIFGCFVGAPSVTLKNFFSALDAEEVSSIRLARTNELYLQEQELTNMLPHISTDIHAKGVHGSLVAFELHGVTVLDVARQLLNDALKMEEGSSDDSKNLTFTYISPTEEQAESDITAFHMTVDAITEQF